MNERDTKICQLYTEGETMEALAVRVGLSKQRIQQIIKKAGLDKTDRPVIRSAPFQSSPFEATFLGAEVNKRTKAALRAEAKKRGISMSQLVAETLEPRTWRKRRAG